MNPLNASRLSSSDEVTTIKMLALKIIFVIVATVLDQFSTAQAGIMTVAMWGVTYYLFDGVRKADSDSFIAAPSMCI
jgi:hypothetical protein